MIVPGKEPVLILHGVAMRKVSDVVKKRDRADDRSLACREIAATPGIPAVVGPDGLHHPARHVIGAQGVLETGVLLEMPLWLTRPRAGASP